jgi:hypothetical protein
MGNTARICNEHEVQMGKRTRMTFARIEESLPVPDLIEIQRIPTSTS